MFFFHKNKLFRNDFKWCKKISLKNRETDCTVINKNNAVQGNYDDALHKKDRVTEKDR